MGVESEEKRLRPESAALLRARLLLKQKQAFLNKLESGPPEPWDVILSDETHKTEPSLDNLVAKADEDWSEEVWLELESQSLKEEASRLSASLDDTFEYVKARCDAIIRAA